MAPSESKTLPQALLNLLVIDDDLRTLELIKEVLSQDALRIYSANHPEHGLDLFFKERPQIVITDLMMPKISGMEVLERIVANDPAVDVILLTAHYSTDSAVEAIQKGACDYLVKPPDLEKLRARVGQLMAEAAVRKRALTLDHELLETYQFEGMIGRSPLILGLFAKVRRIVRIPDRPSEDQTLLDCTTAPNVSKNVPFSTT